MLLSKHQQYILDVLRKMGCLRRSQVLALLSHAFSGDGCPVEERQLEVILRQLRTGTDIRLEGELVRLPHATPNDRLLEAVDVMLELAGDTLLDFKSHKPPLLLRFEAGAAKLKIFSILDTGDTLPLVQRQRHERIIFLIQGDAPPKGVTLPDKHFFAVRQQNGTHRFFSGGE